jgi:hypothetical protein
MRGYPKGALQKVDYENLLAMPEHAKRAARDLAELAKIDDSKIMVNKGTPEQPDIRQIDNPFPSWLNAGFKNKEEMLTIAKVKLEPAPIEEPVEKER